MNICIFDTETFGMLSQDLLNVGYRIVSIDTVTHSVKPIVERDYLVNDIYNGACKLRNEKCVLLNDMKEILSRNFLNEIKFGKYEYLLAEKKIVKRAITSIFKQMESDLTRHNVEYLYAYNCTFDIDKFQRTAEKYHIHNPLDGRTVYDIWSYATNYLVYSEEYIAWANENQVYSATKMHICSSVEAVVKFLHQDLTFEENHTALDDTQYELEILIACIEKGCDITRPQDRKGYIRTSEVRTETIVHDGEEQTIEYVFKRTKNGVTTYYK